MFKTIFVTAWRHMTRNMTAVVLNVSGLAIGIATCLVISIWAERELTFDSFHPEADTKFRIWNTFTSEAETFSQAPSGMALGAQLPKSIPDIASACRVFNTSYKVKYNDEVNFESHAIVADSTFFSFFGFTIVEGASKFLLKDPDHVVLTRSTAIKYFGNVGQAVDKIILVDDVPMTVSAVAENPPSDSHIQFDLVVPYSALHAYALRNWKQDIDNVWVGGWPHTYVQLHDPSKWKEVERRVNNVVAENSKKEWAENKMSYQYFLQPIKSIHLHSDLRYDSPNNGNIMTVRVFIAVAILVLLLACFNYINLTTATSIKRAKEIALRKVAGASRLRLMRQFLLETFFTTLIAVLIGVAFAQITLPYFSSWMGQPYALPLDATHILTLGAFILAVTLLSGVYPAIVLSSFQPIAGLRGKFINSESGQSFRKALVILQFTISTIL
jgi:putative ABC transport system permease protein